MATERRVTHFRGDDCDGGHLTEITGDDVRHDVHPAHALVANAALRLQDAANEAVALMDSAWAGYIDERYRSAYDKALLAREKLSTVVMSLTEVCDGLRELDDAKRRMAHSGPVV